MPTKSLTGTQKILDANATAAKKIIDGSLEHIKVVLVAQQRANRETHEQSVRLFKPAEDLMNESRHMQLLANDASARMSRGFMAMFGM